MGRESRAALPRIAVALGTGFLSAVIFAMGRGGEDLKEARVFLVVVSQCLFVIADLKFGGNS